VDPLTAHLAQIGGLPLVETGGIGFGLVEQIGERGVGQQIVADDAQGRQLLGAGLGAARRHHRRHVPMQHRGRVAEDGETAVFLLKVAIGSHDRLLPRT
jgi:hypothetical protein